MRLTFQDIEKTLFNGTDEQLAELAVAVGEMFDASLLGRELEAKKAVQSSPASFGVRNMEDVEKLGIMGPYRRDFMLLFGMV